MDWWGHAKGALIFLVCLIGLIEVCRNFDQRN